MKSLVKKRRLLIRLTQEDADALEKAARWVSRQRRQIVGESTLLREIAMPRVREIIKDAA